MNKWKEIKPENITLYKVDSIDISALFILYENSQRMGNERNNNVMMATVTPEVWFDDLVPTILSSVSFISKHPNFQTISVSNKDLMAQTYACDKEEFDSLNSLKDFLNERGTLSVLVVYSVIQYVDLKTLKPSWFLRYKEIIDPQAIRDKKINYLTNGVDNN
jgi:hypothetical protein